MTIWVTSDLHIGHINIIKYCPNTRSRFRHVDNMNAIMMTEWNDLVHQDDLVYILGDVSFMSEEKTVNYLNNLQGKKILVQGNHDKKLLKSQNFRSCFIDIHPYLEINHNNTLIVMNHFAIYDHNGAGYGSIMLHGHSHGKPIPFGGRIMDVGFDATGKIVSDLNTIVDDLLKVPHLHHHD